MIPPPNGKFAGRSRSDLKKKFDFVRIFRLRKFFACGPPPPVGKFAERSRSDLKKIDFVKVFGLRKLLAGGTPPGFGLRKF